MFLTAPASVASAERIFSMLKLIRNVLRSTMSQDCPNNLARLRIKSDIVKYIDFDHIIGSFAKKRTRKVAQFPWCMAVAKHETMSSEGVWE